MGEFAPPFYYLPFYFYSYEYYSQSSLLYSCYYLCCLWSWFACISCRKSANIKPYADYRCFYCFGYFLYCFLFYGSLQKRNTITCLFVLLVGMSKLYRLGTLIHQQLNILANDCDLSDKHVHYLHALHSDDCEQSDKLNITNH